MTVSEAAAAKIANAGIVEPDDRYASADDSRRMRGVQERQFTGGAVLQRLRSWVCIYLSLRLDRSS